VRSIKNEVILDISGEDSGYFRLESSARNIPINLRMFAYLDLRLEKKGEWKWGGGQVATVFLRMMFYYDFKKIFLKIIKKGIKKTQNFKLSTELFKRLQKNSPRKSYTQKTKPIYE